MKTYTEFLNESKDQGSIEQKFIEFLTSTKSVNDKKVHQFAKSLGLEASQLENIGYKILTEFFQAGRFHKKKGNVDVDPKQLAMGIKVEMEHTTNRLIAKKIALEVTITQNYQKQNYKNKE